MIINRIISACTAACLSVSTLGAYTVFAQEIETKTLIIPAEADTYVQADDASGEIEGNAGSSARDSLNEVTEYCEEYINTLYTGDAAGAVSEESLADFTTALEAAKTAYANGGLSYSQYNAKLQKLIGCGLSVFGTMKLDDTKIEGSLDDERVFSEYRAEVMKNVFEGETLLRTYPELYTEGDKVELRDKIDFAKSVLDGTYKRPFNRNREFVRPRKDEMLQRLLNHAYVGRVYGYSSDSRFDLKQTIDWYRTANILYDAYSTVSIDPVFDGEIQVASAVDTTKTSAGVGNLCNYRGQLHPNNRNSNKGYILKFNYGALDTVINGVSLEITNASETNSYDMTYAILCDSCDEKVTDGVMIKDLTAGEYVDNTQAVANEDADKLVENKLDSTWEYSSSTVKYNLRQSTDLSRGFQEDTNGVLSVLLYETVPSQNYENWIYTSKAATEEYRPKLVIKTSEVNTSALYEKIEYVKDRYEEFKKWYKPGTELGEVDSDKYNAVETAVNAMDEAWENNEESFVIGSKIVSVYNAMRDARQSRTLLSDIDENSTIFFSEEDGNALKDAIENDEELQSVYNSMKSSADGTSLDQYKEQLPFLGKENYEALGFSAVDGMFDDKGGVSVEYVKEHFKYTTSSNVQATAPENAVTAKVELNLPAGEWEGVGEGQGHVWFDNISGYGTTSSFDIKNPSFETGKKSPDNWTFVNNGSGNSEFKWETTSNLVSDGAKSAYIQNNDAEADASLISDEVAVKAGEQYTVSMDARLDRVLLGNNQLPRYNDSGVRLILHWYDADGNEISSSSVWHNKRAGTGPRCNQTDAIVYFVTGETEYAEKAKYGILLKLNDIAQGAEEWIMTNSRPNGIDAYGGVQIGRNLCVLSQMYSLIKGAGVFSEYEKELMTSLFEENIRFMADYRDRSELTPEDFSDVGNWATDTWAGTAMAAMAMPEYNQSRQLLDNALYLLSGQINTAIGENGTYPESTRYMWAGMNRFSLYAYCNSAYEGLDCFGNTYLGKLYKYALDIQTPYYSYLGYSSSPPFGDNTLSKGSFGLAYAYLDQIYRLDPDLAQALYKTWCDAGRPRVSYSSEDVGMPALFTPTQFEEDTEYKLSLTSNNDYPESMGPIFRDNFGQQGKEMYVAINAPSKTMQHMHDDTGQIIFYANSEPLIMDPGVESYFDATTLGWFKGSASHSVLQFYGSSDWNKCPNPGDSDKPSEVKEFVTNDNIDFASISIQHSAGTQVRNTAYLRGGINALVVWDDVTSTVKARTNWGTQAESVSIDGNKFVSSGHFNMDLETTILPAEDQTRQMSTKWGRMTAAWPNITVDGVEDTYINMEYIEQDAGKDFFAVHYPKEKTAEGTLEATTLAQSGELSVHKLLSPEGMYALVCTNGGQTDGTIALEEDKQYVDMISGALVSGSVKLESGQISFLKPVGETPTSISIATDTGWINSDLTDGKDTATYSADGMALETSAGDGYLKVQYDMDNLYFKASDYPAYMVSFDYKADIQATTDTETGDKKKNDWGFYYTLNAVGSTKPEIANNWKVIRYYTDDVKTDGWIPYHYVHSYSGDEDTEAFRLQFFLRDMNNGGRVEIKNIRVTPMTSGSTYNSDYFKFIGNGLTYNTLTANMTKRVIAWKDASDGGNAYVSSERTDDSKPCALGVSVTLGKDAAVYFQVIGVDKDYVINSITLNQGETNE